MASDADLLRSTLDLLVLKSLTWGPRHGYGVAEWVHQSTGGHLAKPFTPRELATCIAPWLPEASLAVR